MLSVQRKLGNRATSTASECVAVREAVCFVYSSIAAHWFIFGDSKLALQITQALLRRANYEQLACDIKQSNGETSSLLNG